MSKHFQEDSQVGIERPPINESLVEELAKTINTARKGQLPAAFIIGKHDTAADVKSWVSTGSSMLDLAICNRPYGGMPAGRITEVTGLEASGKSLLAAHAIVSTQKQGGVGVFIDTESAVSAEFFHAIGVDMSRMLYLQVDTAEEIFESIETVLARLSKDSYNKPVTIVVDSLMAASTKIEMAAEYDKDGYATAKAIIISKAMRKITNMIARKKVALIMTNQLRQKLGVMFGDPWTTSGGKAVAFHSSVRLRLKQMGQIKAKINGVEQVVGIKTRATVIKNRIGPPFRSVDYDIYFDSGIDDAGGWLQMMKDYDLIKQGGAWYTYIDEDSGEEIKFQSKDFVTKLLNDPDIESSIYNKICEKYIFKYRANEDGGIDDVEIEDGVPDENG